MFLRITNTVASRMRMTAWMLGVPLLATLVAGLIVYKPKPASSSRKPAVIQYHGVKVIDDYQWLENPADPAVRQWSENQDNLARSVLTNLLTRPWVEDRLNRLLSNSSADYSSLKWRKGRFFALKTETST